MIIAVLRADADSLVIAANRDQAAALGEWPVASRLRTPGNSSSSAGAAPASATIEIRPTALSFANLSSICANSFAVSFGALPRGLVQARRHRWHAPRVGSLLLPGSRLANQTLCSTFTRILNLPINGLPILG